jgi:hypothetical protein
LLRWHIWSVNSRIPLKVVLREVAAVEALAIRRKPTTKRIVITAEIR